MTACGTASKVTFQDKSTVVHECSDEETTSGIDCNDCRFIFEANTATLVWVVVHPLNCYPSYTILDANGNVIEGGVKYISPSRIEIHFSLPQSGKVLLN